VRLTMGLLIIFVSSSIVAKSTHAEADQTPQRAKQRYLVFCRWFDENGDYFTTGIRSLANGEHARIHPSSPTIDVAVTAVPQPDGATVNIAVGKANAHEKHVARFAKFNETLVIPLGAKSPSGATPRVEILVGGATSFAGTGIGMWKGLIEVLQRPREKPSFAPSRPRVQPESRVTRTPDWRP
jgi:hypothetical protein